MIKAAKGVFLAAVMFLLASCATTETGGYVTYDTANEPKAKGLSVQVRYPAGWIAQGDEKRSSIVQTFRHVENGLAEHLMLQVIPAGKEGETLFGDEKRFDASPRKAVWVYLLKKIAGAEVRDIRAATYAGQPAVFADLAVGSGAGRGMMAMENRVMMVYYKAHMLTLACGVTGKAENRSEVEARQRANTEGLCRHFFDSLKLME